MRSGRCREGRRRVPTVVGFGVGLAGSAEGKELEGMGCEEVGCSGRGEESLEIVDGLAPKDPAGQLELVGPCQAW